MWDFKRLVLVQILRGPWVLRELRGASWSIGLAMLRAPLSAGAVLPRIIYADRLFCCAVVPMAPFFQLKNLSGFGFADKNAVVKASARYGVGGQVRNRIVGNCNCEPEKIGNFRRTG